MRIEACAFWVALSLVSTPTALLAEPAAITVTAVAETEATEGDADDPAIWVHPSDPARSRILGTDKKIGLRVYDLSGRLVQDFPDGALNNVDLREVTLQGASVTIAGATKRENDTLVFYVIGQDGAVRRAQPFAHAGAPHALEGEVDDIYGFAMQKLPDGRVFALANYKSGHVFQWELIDENGVIALRLARQWRVPSQPEGIVSDDRTGDIYIGEEDAAIWRFPGAPEAEPMGEIVARIGDPCLPVDDVEGLAIYDGSDEGRERYLIASAQGIHRAAIYRLPEMRCVGLVEIAAGAVDGVSETDGLEVTSRPLPGHPQGLLVMMDDQNAGFTTNFKLIDWAAIRAQLDPGQ